MPLNQSSADRFRFIKLAAVPVLGITLIALIWPGSQPEVMEPAATPRARKTPISSISAINGLDVESDWKALAQISGNLENPFAPLAVLSQQPIEHALNTEISPSRPEETAAPGSDRGRDSLLVNVQAIHKINGSYCALIGNKLLRVGDKLPDGRRIASISLVGVLVEKE